MLDNPDWKYDVIPEIMDGKNIGDFVDPDILEKLHQLEQEEEMLDQAEMEDEEDLEKERILENARNEVSRKRDLIKQQHHMKMKQSVILEPTLGEAKEAFKKKGIDTAFLEKRAELAKAKMEKAK